MLYEVITDSAQDLWATFDAEKLQEITGDVRLKIKVDDLSRITSYNVCYTKLLRYRITHR